MVISLEHGPGTYIRKAADKDKYRGCSNVAASAFGHSFHGNGFTYWSARREWEVMIPMPQVTPDYVQVYGLCDHCAETWGIEELDYKYSTNNIYFTPNW